MTVGQVSTAPLTKQQRPILARPAGGPHELRQNPPFTSAMLVGEFTRGGLLLPINRLSYYGEVTGRERLFCRYHSIPVIKKKNKCAYRPYENRWRKQKAKSITFAVLLRNCIECAFPSPVFCMREYEWRCRINSILFLFRIHVIHTSYFPSHSK